MVEALRAARPDAEVRYCDTVCQPTKDRQHAMKKLVAQSEVVIVVGGHGSNNTRQLVLAARAAGRRAYQIERPDELDPRWLDGAAAVGLTAGTLHAARHGARRARAFAGNRRVTSPGPS